MYGDGLVCEGGTRRKKPARRQGSDALILVPLDRSQHRTLRFPQAVDMFCVWCDDGHNGLLLVVFVAKSGD